VARRGNLRASDADRDRIVDRLRKASVEGRLASHEFEHRVTSALNARTYAELDATVADLPGDRLGERLSAQQRVMRTVRAHPSLLLVAIPVALATLATLVAITVLWSVLLLVVFLLGYRRHRYLGPWTYWGWHRFRMPHSPSGGRGHCL
jgi:Domain of unknown function (DUF1707)